MKPFITEPVPELPILSLATLIESGGGLNPPPPPTETAQPSRTRHWGHKVWKKREKTKARQRKHKSRAPQPYTGKKRGAKPKHRPATCHPTMPHYGRGLCRDCGQREERWKRAGINMTVPRYNEMLKQQDGCCAICQREPRGRRLAVDHNHSTGRVRGLLCMPCNRLLLPLLQFHVPPERIYRAADYLAADLNSE